jgi:hypothetical protein
LNEYLIKKSTCSKAELRRISRLRYYQKHASDINEKLRLFNVMNREEKNKKRRFLYLMKQDQILKHREVNEYLIKKPTCSKAELILRCYQKHASDINEKLCLCNVMNREEINKKRRLRYLMNREEINKKRRLRYLMKQEQILKRKREGYKMHQKKAVEYCHKYYSEHREEVLKYRHNYYNEHRIEVLKYQLDYNSEHQKKVSEYHHDYYQKYPEKICRSRLYNVSSYLIDISKGPTHTCISCGRLFFDRSMTVLKYSQMLEKCTLDFLTTACPCIKNSDNDDNLCDEMGYACSNCKLYLIQSRIPPLSLAHEELQFPDIPPELEKLTPLEERFVAPRIAFIQIRTSVIDDQKSSKGRIVNVPSNPQSSIEMLPRNYENLGVIMVQLKKCKSFKSNVMPTSPVRIDVIQQAALYLLNSEVYQEAKIEMNLQDFENIITDACNKLDDKSVDVNSNDDEHNDNSDFEIRSISCESISGNDENMNVESENEIDWSTDVNNDQSENIPLRNDDDETCLQQGYIFAPGENNSPISVLRDYYADSLTFVKLYAGTLRHIPKHLSYQKVLQSEICRYDRRCCDPYLIFYGASKLRIQKMLNSQQLNLRKQRFGGSNITAGQLLNDTFVSNL